MTSVVGSDLDRQALILLCVPTSMGGGAAPAFGPVAWHRFERVLQQQRFTPGRLLGMSASEMEEGIGFTADQADRVSRLLGRGGPVAIEIERLASRGIRITALGDETYPKHLSARLGDQTPPILFGAGSAAIATEEGLAIVGSREADEEAIIFTEAVAASAVKGGLTIISGAARGVDAAAMNSALEHGGSAVGVLAEGLEKRIREPQVRAWLTDERLYLLTPYANAPFSVGGAMGRNKLIYALSGFAVVVAATPGKGGTWAGATEALRNGWSKLFVRGVLGDHSASGPLVAQGATLFPEEVPDTITRDFLTALSTPEHGRSLSGRTASGTERAAAALQVTLFGEPEPMAESGNPKRR